MGMRGTGLDVGGLEFSALPLFMAQGKFKEGPGPLIPRSRREQAEQVPAHWGMTLRKVLGPSSHSSHGNP